MLGYANPFDTGGPSPIDFNEDYYLNSNPEAAFMRYLQSVGLNGSGAGNPTASYAQAQRSRVYNNYSAEAASDPNMGFYDYLKKNKIDFNQEYMNQSPEQRGDYSSRIMTPRARWVVG